MPSTSRWFLGDQAITDKEDDAFAHDDVAAQLADIIDAIDAPATIGLVGGFGTGKSSITNLLAKRLNGHRTYQLVSLSAEKHTDVARQRALVYSFAQALHEDAGVDRKKIDGLLERLEHDVVSEGTELDALPFTRWFQENKGRLRRPVLNAVAIAVAVYLVLVGVLALTNWVGWTDVNPFAWMLAPALAVFVSAAGVLGLGAALPAWVKAGLTPDTIRRSRPRIEAADEFERLFGDLADLCDKRLVVVVDDIDRLSPNEVLEAVSSVRTFESIPHKEVIFVLTCDERVIREAIARANPGLSEVDNSAVKAADEYLHKLFVVRQPLPPHLNQDMRSYADKLLARANHAGPNALGADAPRVLDILIHDRVESPRHVIRLLNAFFTDYRLASVREGNGRLQKGEVTGRPTLLARLTVLRVDFWQFFDEVVDEFGLLDAVDALLLGAALDTEQETIVRTAFKVPESHDVDAAAVPVELGDFLRRTVRHVDRDRPLTAFIYLGQTDAGRVLGSERAEQIRRSLENGNAAELVARFTEGGDVALAALDHTIESVKRARPGLPLTNAASAAAEALSAAPESRRAELANELAVTIEREPEAAPSPDRLANVIRAAASSHQQALLRIISAFAGGEAPGERQQRSLVLFELAADDPDREVLKQALSGYFATLHEEADSGVIPTWVEAVTRVPVERRNRILDTSFFKAVAALLVGTPAGGSQDWRSGLAALVVSSPASQDIDVQQALLAALTADGIEPRRAVMSIVADLSLDPAIVGAFVEAVASVVTDEAPEAGAEDVATAIGLIGKWSKSYADHLDADGEVGVAAMAALAEAASDQPAIVAAAFSDVVAAFAAPAAEVISPLLAALDGHRSVGDELGVVIRTALLSATDDAAAADTDSMLTGLLSSVSVGALPETPEVQFALEAIRHAVQRDAARTRLATEIARWIDLLNQATDDPNTYLTPLHALALVGTAGLVSADQARALLSRLTAIQASGPPHLSSASRGIALVPWPADLRGEATAALAAHFTNLSESDQQAIGSAISHWPGTTPDEIDDTLQDSIVSWTTAPDHDHDRVVVAERLWPGLALPRRAQLVAALLPEAPELKVAVLTLDEETLQQALIASVVAGTFDDVSEASKSHPNAGSVFGGFIRTSFDPAQSPWSHDAVVSAATIIDDTTAEELVATAMEALEQGEEQAARGATLLAALNQRVSPARPAQPELIERVAALLDTVSPDVAEHLGRASAWVSLNEFRDHLKELRKRKDDQRAREAAERFEAGHRQAG